MNDSVELSEAYKKVVLEIKHRARVNIISGDSGLSSTVNIPLIREVLRENHALPLDANEVFNLIEFGNEVGFTFLTGWGEESQINSSFSQLIEYVSSNSGVVSWWRHLRPVSAKNATN